MLRRSLLTLFSVGVTVCALPMRLWARNKDAFAATKLADSLQLFFPGHEITRADEQITLQIAATVEDGAVVPIKVSTTLDAVSSIAIFVANNPNPLIASFNLTANCKAAVATRIKIGEPSEVIAVVTANKKLYHTQKFITVSQNGCA